MPFTLDPLSAIEQMFAAGRQRRTSPEPQLTPYQRMVQQEQNRAAMAQYAGVPQQQAAPSRRIVGSLEGAPHPESFDQPEMTAQSMPRLGGAPLAQAVAQQVAPAAPPQPVRSIAEPFGQMPTPVVQGANFRIPAGAVQMNPNQLNVTDMGGGPDMSDYRQRPDHTLEQLVRGAATNFTKDFVGVNGSIYPTDNPDRRMAALAMMERDQNEGKRLAAAEREKALDRAAGLEQARIQAGANNDHLRGALSLIETGQAGSLGEAMQMIRGAMSGTPEPAQANANPTNWNDPSVRAVLDRVAGVTRSGRFASAPQNSDISAFQRALHDQFPGTDFSAVIEPYIRAHWPQTAVDRWLGGRIGGSPFIGPYNQQRTPPPPFRLFSESLPFTGEFGFGS